MIWLILMLVLCSECYSLPEPNCTSIMDSINSTEILAEQVLSDIKSVKQQTSDAVYGIKDMMLNMTEEFNSIIAAGNQTINELKDRVTGMQHMNEEIRFEFNNKLAESNKSIEELKGQLGIKPNVLFLVKNPTTQNPGSGSTIKFRAYMRDTSGSYNSTTGQFTAPVNGTYLFMAQLCLNGGDDERWIHYAILAGGRQVANSLLNKPGGGNYRFCNTVQALVKLNKGETSEVRSLYHTPVALAPNGPNEWNTFSGVLLN